ncbi:MAG: stage II sporulation protein P [Lachnospiraceae bacterium]|nr:stage II sporulation protein P [Lachnospiraceae bacterium]
MFIRFVGNKRKRLYRPACVGLAAILAVSCICRALEYIDGETLGNAIGNVSVAIFKHIVENEYNIAGYDDAEVNKDHKNKEEDQVVSKLLEAINGQSSLYGYMNSKDEDITYTSIDPMYDYAQIVVDKADVSEGNVDVADNSENGNTDINPGNGTAAEEEAETPTENNDNQPAKTAESDYVVPAVSDSGITYSMEQLSDFDFLMSKLYTVPSRALVYESDLVAEDMLSKDMTIQGDNSKPQILIYHTHSQEGFADSIPGDDSTSIVAVGAYLVKILSEEYGYNVIHCQEHFDIAGGSLDRSKAYTYAQYTIEQILEDNPSIDVILDIHRDGLAEGADKLVTNINGKDTAKIMFFNGVSRSSAAGDIDYLYNRYRADNLAFSFQLKLKAMECYPEFTRRNYIDAYQYNLHHRQKSVLVEVGAQNNTLQEELNAMEVLAEVLHRVISPDKEN